jgi:hypothetical protein
MPPANTLVDVVALDLVRVRHRVPWNWRRRFMYSSSSLANPTTDVRILSRIITPPYEGAAERLVGQSHKKLGWRAVARHVQCSAVQWHRRKRWDPLEVRTAARKQKLRHAHTKYRSPYVLYGMAFCGCRDAYLQMRKNQPKLLGEKNI